MAARLIRGLWQTATEWLLALTVLSGLFLARGLVGVPLAVPMAATAGPVSQAPPAPDPAPAPEAKPAVAIDGARVVEVAALISTFASLLARLWLKDRELKRQHADKLVEAYRELADLKQDTAKLDATVTALRAACPHQETCPVKLLDRLPSLRPTVTPADPRPTKAEIDSDL